MEVSPAPAMFTEEKTVALPDSLWFSLVPQTHISGTRLDTFVLGLKNEGASHWESSESFTSILAQPIAMCLKLRSFCSSSGTNSSPGLPLKCDSSSQMGYSPLLLIKGKFFIIILKHFTYASFPRYCLTHPETMCERRTRLFI